MMETAYSRAVDLFERLVEAPGMASHDTPADLIRAAAVSLSSGYRHVAALEAEGFLRRDPAGTYLTGASALRIGFSGFGLGNIAPLAQPVLLRLRQATQHTAFLGIVKDLDLYMGPYSSGRETRSVLPQPVYGFETIPDLTLGQTTETTLRSQAGQVVRRTGALVASVTSTTDTLIILGVLLQPGRGATDQLSQTLTNACAHILETLEE